MHIGHYTAASRAEHGQLASCEVLSCLGRLCCCAGSGRYLAGRYSAGRQAGPECQSQLCLLPSRDAEKAGAHATAFVRHV